MITFRRTANGNGVIVSDTNVTPSREWKLRADLNVYPHPCEAGYVVVSQDIRLVFPKSGDVDVFKVEDIVGRPSNNDSEVAVWLGDNFFFVEYGTGGGVIGIDRGIRLNFYDNNIIKVPNIPTLPLHVDVWVRTTDKTATQWGLVQFGEPGWSCYFPSRALEGDKRLADSSILSVDYLQDTDELCVELDNTYRGTLTLTY